MTLLLCFLWSSACWTLLEVSSDSYDIDPFSCFTPYVVADRNNLSSSSSHLHHASPWCSDAAKRTAVMCRVMYESWKRLFLLSVGDMLFENWKINTPPKNVVWMVAFILFSCLEQICVLKCDEDLTIVTQRSMTLIYRSVLWQIFGYQ